MRRTTIFATALVLVLFTIVPTHSQPVITQDYAFIENSPAGSIIGPPGLQLELLLNVTDPGGLPALTGAGSSERATSTNPSFPFSQPINMAFGSGAFPVAGGGQFVSVFLLSGVGQFPAVTGTYIFMVTDTGSQSATATSHSLDKAEVIPLPTGLTFSDNSTTPVFTFTDPNPTPGVTGLVRRYSMDILDSTKKAIFSADRNSLTSSFTVPAGLLQVGQEYYFRADSLDFDTTEGYVSGPGIPLENRATQYATFQPTSVPEPFALLLLSSGVLGFVALRGCGWGRR
jgi:hypothetical protein